MKIRDKTLLEMRVQHSFLEIRLHEMYVNTVHYWEINTNMQTFCAEYAFYPLITRFINWLCLNQFIQDREKTRIPKLYKENRFVYLNKQFENCGYISDKDIK